MPSNIILVSDACASARARATGRYKKYDSIFIADQSYRHIRCVVCAHWNMSGWTVERVLIDCDRWSIGDSLCHSVNWWMMAMTAGQNYCKFTICNLQFTYRMILSRKFTQTNRRTDWLNGDIGVNIIESVVRWSSMMNGICPWTLNNDCLLAVRTYHTHSLDAMVDAMWSELIFTQTHEPREIMPKRKPSSIRLNNGGPEMKGARNSQKNQWFAIRHVPCVCITPGIERVSTPLCGMSCAPHCRTEDRREFPSRIERAKKKTNKQRRLALAFAFVRFIPFHYWVLFVINTCLKCKCNSWLERAHSKPKTKHTHSTHRAPAKRQKTPRPTTKQSTRISIGPIDDSNVLRRGLPSHKPHGVLSIWIWIVYWCRSHSASPNRD